MSKEELGFVKRENILTCYIPKIISYECTRKIMEQMERNICQIRVGNEQGTEFFCKIPFPDKHNMLPVFITNNHVINEDFLYSENAKIIIYIKNEKNVKEINLNNRMNYSNKYQDITIFEIKDNDNIQNYLELDDIIIDGILNEENNNKEYVDGTIYILHYPEGVLSVSYGILDNISMEQKYIFRHKCST